MNSKMPRLLATGALALAGVLVTAVPAAAIPGTDPGDVEDPTTAPGAYKELYVTSATVVPYGTSEWQVSVTVHNDGNVESGAFTNAYRINGVSLVTSRSQASIPYKSSRRYVPHSSDRLLHRAQRERRLGQRGDGAVRGQQRSLDGRSIN